MEQASVFLSQQINSKVFVQLFVPDCFSAEATRLHNNANILAMGGRVVGPGLAIKIVDTFLNTPFSEEERHIRRIKQIEEDTDITDAYPEI